MVSTLSILRDAVRALRASPLTTALGVISLALGIGANAALFSLLNGLLLKPLPVAKPNELALLAGGSWTNPIWEQVRDRDRELFAGAFAWSAERFDMSSGGQTEFVDGLYASGRMFDVLGISPVLGRLLTEADDTPGGSADGAVAVISESFWQRRFGGASDAIGQTLTLERVPFRIVGVTPRGFFGPDVGRAADVMLPLATERLIRGNESFLDGRSTWWLEMMARLKPGQTLEQATQALRVIQPAIREATMPPQYPAAARERYLKEGMTWIDASAGKSEVRSRYETPLLTLMAVAGLVLLIACANVANLLLARATARRRDLSIRLALGSTRMRLIVQMLMESLLLATIGASAGVFLAKGGSALLLNQLTTWRSVVSVDLAMDWRFIAFALGLTVTTAVIFGLAPALSVAHVAPQEALKEAGRGVAGDRRLGARGALVAGQIALSLLLVVAAGLFLRTFISLTLVPLGLAPNGLVIIDVNLQRLGNDQAARAAAMARLCDATAVVPGVTHVAASMITPLSGRGWNTGIGAQIVDSRERMSWMNGVSPDWFTTLGAHVLAGRDFSTADGPGGDKVAIVNETFARRFLSDGPVVGRTVQSGQSHFAIVGLVSDMAYRSAREGMVPTMYVPLAQTDRLPPSMSLMVRVASMPSASLRRSLSAALNAADPRVAFTYRSFDDLIGATVAQERIVAVLSAGFGILAIVLAAIGLYGVMSYAVSRQRTDFGVRMALGATPRMILALVIGRASLPLGTGVLVGVAGSIWASGLVGKLLFNVRPRDAMTIAGAAVLLLLVGLLAAAIPAWRASRIDPAGVLRES